MIVKGSCTFLSDKRPYLPGIVAHANCPKCKMDQDLDLASNYPWGMEEDGSCFLSFY